MSTLTRAELALRGWTVTTIRRLLDEPDEVRTYTTGRKRVTTYLYEVARVVAVEASPAFVEARERLAARRAAPAVQARQAAAATRKVAAEDALWRIAKALAATRGDSIDAYAVRVLHAVNRRAKHEHNPARLYIAKKEVLVALLASGQATVQRFERATGRRVCECSCGQRWTYDHADDYGDHCYRCSWLGGGRVRVVDAVDCWYLVGAYGYTFHARARDLPDALVAGATPCEPHDPTQPRREVPEVGLALDEQLRFLRLWLRIPVEVDHRFRSKPISDSGPSRSPIPVEVDHPHH